jgi:hypothetical protein
MWLVAPRAPSLRPTDPSIQINRPTPTFSAYSTASPTRFVITLCEVISLSRLQHKSEEITVNFIIDFIIRSFKTNENHYNF